MAKFEWQDLDVNSISPTQEMFPDQTPNGFFIRKLHLFSHLLN